MELMSRSSSFAGQRLCEMRLRHSVVSGLFGLAAAAVGVLHGTPAHGQEQKQGAEPTATSDELPNGGYIPGYKPYSGLGMSPYIPRVPGFPGGMTPSFSAPTPTEDWTFSYSGYMSMSLQVSVDEREDPQPGQKKLVLHTLPVVIDEYNSWTSTNSLPGNWVNMQFNYGNSVVTAIVSINTYNPTRPTNFWQIGGQYGLNNMFLRFRIPPIGPLRITSNVGFFTNNYGTLGQYGGGFYTHAIIGGPTGVGETTTFEYDLDDTYTLVFEHGFMGNRNGKQPNDLIANTGSGGDPAWPAAFTHHAHAGLVKRGDTTLALQAHYVTSWAQDDRIQLDPGNPYVPIDLPTTREVDESYVRDGRLTVVGADFKMISPTWGVLGVGVGYIDGEYAFPLRGLTTFAGDGERLTNSWWGVTTGGTGTLLLGGISYSFSIADFVLYPEPFTGGAPDIQVTLGFDIGRTTSAEAEYDGRVRHKYGADALYQFLPWLGAGARFDRVVPSSKDSGQTYHVLNTRLQFKTDWQSRENITLSYVRWFFGPTSHLDGLSTRSSERIDDEMFTLNFNMYW
jgi:hypothetical protein